jgi:transcriptional regulator with XRE-family HTH domain
MLGDMATLKVTDKVGELLTGDLGSELKEQRETARLSLRQLATAAGVSNPYLSQIERGLRRPSAEVLQQIAKGLQISAEALFLRAGILEESEGLHVEVAIQSDLNLTARQKRVLLDIYTTFRAENARADAANGTDPDTAGEPATAAAATPDGAATATPETAARKAAVKKTAAKKATAKKVAAKKAAKSTAATKAAVKRATKKAAATSDPALAEDAPDPAA